MTKSKYDDLLDLPRHQSQKHPPMSRSDRAAQFAPFAALKGFVEVVEEIELDEVPSEKGPEQKPR